MMAAALTLYPEFERDLYLFDTYDGMPAPGEHDFDHTGAAAGSLLAKDPTRVGNVAAVARLNEVIRNMESTGYPAHKLHYVEGRVVEMIPFLAPEKIALLRLDTDWYESTRHELIHLFPRVVPGGVLIIDDYGHWLGARQAVDKYFEESNTQILLVRIDYTGRIAVVP